MPGELVIKPRGSSFLRTNAQEIRARIAGGPVMLFSIAIVAVARFEWPSPTHRAIISIRHLKSKPECGLPRISAGVDNCNKWKTPLAIEFLSCHPLTLEANERE
jgi:hypothetical protein